MLRLALLTLLLPLTGCVTMPESLRGEFAPLQPIEAARSGIVGAPVRWGGRVVQVEPLAEHSCFEVIGVPLDIDGRPLARDESSGRFLACRAGFYDPEVFLPGREMTFIGRIDGYETRKIGEYDYRYPRLAADVVFLWPERTVGAIVEQYPYWWGW
jgi:outer membrane lipoprotein